MLLMCSFSSQPFTTFPFFHHGVFGTNTRAMAISMFFLRWRLNFMGKFVAYGSGSILFPASTYLLTRSPKPILDFK